MTISGSFTALAAQRQPMAAAPPPNVRHGQKSQPDNAWSTPPASAGGGAPWAAAEVPQMSARGIVLDMGHRWGHGGTIATRKARRPFTAARLLGRRIDAPYVEQSAAQETAANAHGDTSAGYFGGHQYDPMPQQFAGSSYEVLGNNVQAIPSTGARTIAKSRLGGGFVDGSGGDFAPTGFHIGIGGPGQRRWAQARYSSPTLGAMYSRNSLRGILPQTIAVPVNQPALTGGQAGDNNSGIGSNARFLGKQFTLPQLFRSPPSESDQLMATSSPSTGGSTMGVGF